MAVVGDSSRVAWRVKVIWNPPAMIKSAIPSPHLLYRFSKLHRKKAYGDRFTPFNFLLSATVHSFDRPAGVSEFHLIAPYSRNPADWLRSWWTDLHSGDRYRIRTNEPTSGSTIRVQTFGDVIDRFRMHPEAKSAGPDGAPATRGTIGLLGRLDVRILYATHIGKESNLLEQQEEGILLDDPQAIYWGAGEWEGIRSQLDRVSIPELAERSGVSPRMLRNLLKGDRRPSAKTLEAIAAALLRLLE